MILHLMLWMDKTFMWWLHKIQMKKVIIHINQVVLVWKINIGILVLHLNNKSLFLLMLITIKTICIILNVSMDNIKSKKKTRDMLKMVKIRWKLVSKTNPQKQALLFYQKISCINQSQLALMCAIRSLISRRIV